MRPSCERSSDPERRAKSRPAKGIALGSLTFLAACSAIDAEVGAVPPAFLDAATDGRPATDSAPRPTDAGADGLEGGIVGRCDPSAPLRLYYRNLTADASSNNINYIVKVQNATAAALPLRSLDIRYYLTNELASPWAIDVFYADTCCSNKTTGFNDQVVRSLQAIAARPSADAYLGISFTSAAGSLEPGDAVQVELGLHDPSYARNLVQSNDYSYLAAATGTQSQWNDCPGPQCEPKFTTCSLTVYRDGLLVWGTPP